LSYPFYTNQTTLSCLSIFLPHNPLCGCLGYTTSANT
jgi:hypothetical protein